jgi:uncharacterized membrane protein
MGDSVSLIGGLALIVAFFVLPWAAQNNATPTASGFMPGFFEGTPITSPTSVLLIGIAMVVALLGGIVGTVNPESRHISRFIAAIGGVVGLVYYLSVYLGLQTPPTAEASPALGFWIALIASVVLVVQLFIPRPNLQPLTTTDKLRAIQFLVVIAGLIVTGYMSYNKLANIPLACSETGLINCAIVENSAWSRVAGIPTALLGFIAHVMLGTVLVLEKRISIFTDHAPLFLFGIALFSVCYHLYLTYVSFFILRALCPFCLTAAVIMIIELVISSIRFKRYLSSS